MEILICTNSLNLLGLANRLVEEGHDVKVFSQIRLPDAYGMFTSVKHPYESVKSCKFIVADAVELPDIYTWAKSFNKPIIGCNPMTDLMNTDCHREYTVGIKVGANMPPTEVIQDMSHMYSKVLDWNPSRTLVRYDRETIGCDHREWLTWAMYKLPLNKKVLLQTPEMGEYVTVFGWFDGLKWAKPFIIKTEKEGDLNASLLLGLTDREWMEKTIEPWGSFLRAVDYHGPFSVRCIASKKTIHVISTYAGIEFPSIYAFIEGLMEPVGDFLNRVALGVCDGQDLTSDYMSSIVVRSGLKSPAGIPILGLDTGNQKHLFFGAVARVESDLVIAPGPWIYTATAHGRDADESFGRAYFTSRIVKVPEPSYTTGMASVYKPWLQKLNSLELI